MTAVVDIFEFEEKPVDTLDQILGVAASVLEDDADDYSTTRLSRMARWIVLNAGAPPCFTKVGGITRHTIREPDPIHDEHGLHVWRVGDHVGITVPAPSRKLSSDEIRALSAALLRALDEAES